MNVRRAALLASSLGLFVVACAGLVGIDELPPLPAEGGLADSPAVDGGPTDARPDVGTDSSRTDATQDSPHDAAAHDALFDGPLSDAFDGGGGDTSS